MTNPPSSIPPQSTSPSPAQPSTLPKRRTWLFWLLGGIATMVVLCIGSVVVGGFFLIRYAQTTASPVASRSTPIYDVNANANADIRRALAQAKQEDKLVLIDFGADWCVDCVVLANHFDDPEVKPFLDANFIVVHVNVGEWDANLDVSEKYGDPIAKGIPAVVVLSPDEEMLVTTGGGELANARTSSKNDILTLLKQWAARL